MKVAVISKSQQFAEALESLNTEDMDALKSDFHEVFELFQNDLKKEIEEEDPENEKAWEPEEGDDETRDATTSEGEDKNEEEQEQENAEDAEAEPYKELCVKK